MMKTEDSVKGLMLLTSMRHYVSENRRKKLGQGAPGQRGQREEADEDFLEVREAD